MYTLSWSPSGFNSVYRRYRFLALAVYSVILLASLIDWAYGGIGPSSVLLAPENVRFVIFVLVMLILIGLELFGFGHKSFEEKKTLNLLPFILRLSLLAIAFLITDLHYTRVLFLIIILYSYLGVRKWLSYSLAFLGVFVLIGLSVSNPVLMGIVPAPPTGQLIGQQNPPPRPEQPPINLGALIDASMGSVIALFFTLLLARAMAQVLQDQQKLETSHTQLKQYASRVAELATTEERNRLARDIHDSLGHHLAAINIQLEKANAYREIDAKRANQAVGNAQRSVQNALKDVRESVSSLREEGEAFSFDDSLDTLVKHMEHSHLKITVEKFGNSTNSSKLALMSLYRVIQEGLTNVHKHAHASEVTIKLEFTDDHTSLELSDNGVGFDVSHWKNQPEQSSFGLQGLEERLSLLGGKLTICSHAQKTSLRASLPKLHLITSGNNA